MSTSNREFKAGKFEFELKESGGIMTIEGYGSTFGNVDSYRDIVAKGAFQKSLRSTMPKMLYQHDPRKIAGVIQLPAVRPPEPK